MISRSGCFNLEPTLFAGLLLAFLCVTKKEKLQLEDTGDSGGILLKSNTEAPGEEVVQTTPAYLLHACAGSTFLFVFNFT